MISTCSRPARRRLSATNSAARSTSCLCSGSVLMLGMRIRSFSSSSRRWRFCCTKASVAADMVPREPLYGCHRMRLLQARACIPENAADLGLVEGLRDQVVSAQVQRFRPEAGIGGCIGDQNLHVARAIPGNVQSIQPVSIGQVGFGENELNFIVAKHGARLLQTVSVFDFERELVQHAREAVSVFLPLSDEENLRPHTAHLKIL